MPAIISESPEKELIIEFLKCGTHTSMSGSSHNFTHDIAQEIVETYDPDNFKAPLIVSHRTGKYSDREIIESELAFGTPKLLKKVGDRLKAVFEKISPDFVEWVRNNQILGISPSFYPPDHPSNPTPGKWSLRHIAGLGKSPPAIKGLASLSLSEFLSSKSGAIDLGEFDYSAETSGAITLDFMSEGCEVFQRLRDYLIEKEGIETADRIIPSYYLQLVNESPKNDYPFELIEQLMMRVSDLENRLNLNSLQPIYSEPINFALPKTPGAAKEKNCKKGTPCKGTCINANKTCIVKQSPESTAKTKSLKEKIGSLPKAESKPKAEPKREALGTETSAPKTSPKTETSEIPTLEEAASKLTFVGEGIEGPIYRDGNKAIKYFRTVAGREEQDFENIEAAGNLGIAPKMLGQKDRKVLVMEFLDGYNVGFSKGSDSGDDEISLLDTSSDKKAQEGFFKALKVAHDNGYKVGDLHEENFMSNSAGDVKFIDQAGFAKAPPSSRLRQLLDPYTSRPLASDVVRTYADAHLDKKSSREIKKIQKQLLSDKFTTEEQYTEALNKTYQLLGVK